MVQGRGQAENPGLASDSLGLGRAEITSYFFNTQSKVLYLARYEFSDDVCKVLSDPVINYQYSNTEKQCI